MIHPPGDRKVQIFLQMSEEQHHPKSLSTTTNFCQSPAGATSITRLQSVCVYVCSPHQPIGHQPYPVMYAVANPVRAPELSNSIRTININHTDWTLYK